MNYEQKYKKALEMAREAFYNQKTPHVAKAWLLTMFPIIVENEIAESENEWTRKELIAHCKNTRCVTKEGAEKISKWITWLEKQGNMLEPDRVIKWLNDQACQGWIEDVEVDIFVDKFKKDFKL